MSTALFLMVIFPIVAITYVIGRSVGEAQERYNKFK